MIYRLCFVVQLYMLWRFRPYSHVVFQTVFTCYVSDRIHIVDSLPHIWLLDGRIVTCKQWRVLTYFFDWPERICIECQCFTRESERFTWIHVESTMQVDLWCHGLCIGMSPAIFCIFVVSCWTPSSRPFLYWICIFSEASCKCILCFRVRLLASPANEL